MNDWVDLSALWRIVALGLVCGAGLPALFALGLKALNIGETDSAEGASSSAVITTRNPVALTAAGLCFAVVLAAIVWGIYLIVAGT